ncbi:MAG: T9SS type A sorting domain-containing protein, partial [Ignavibacteriaceae bacterium]|nr:T9SS type A sorting domain-containing protein [Ignavibacteriaceae bacterium]
FSNTVFSFIDNSVIFDIEAEPNIVEYKVSSFNGLTESFTNITSFLPVVFNWDSGLLLTQNNNHPILVWVPHPTFTTTHYKVYRALSNQPSQHPLTLTYSNIATVSSSTFSITDMDITLDPSPDKYAFYYVKAYNSGNSTYSDMTNIVNAAGDYLPQKKGTEGIEIYNYQLLSNYPNPFNPTTEISYSIAKDDFVSLSVYDILGREVEKLVSEVKPAGNYKVTFNGSNISSGVYFYQLKAGEFSSIKKLVLAK